MCQWLRSGRQHNWEAGGQNTGRIIYMGTEATDHYDGSVGQSDREPDLSQEMRRCDPGCEDACRERTVMWRNHVWPRLM